MIAQSIILLTGAIAILFTQLDKDILNQLAPFIGLAGQPFWLYETYSKRQLGMFSLSVFYTGAWCVGVYNNLPSFI